MAVGIDNSKPDSYELEILTIVNNEGEGFDVRDLMIECVLSESIQSNFLQGCLLYTSPSPRDQRGCRMPSSA